MVKKKTSDQHESGPKDHDEKADNQEDNEAKEAVDPQSGEESQPEAEIESGQPSSEKPAPEEKSTEEKLAEMQDRYLRVSAEFDNYRRRTLREKMELSKYAAENLLLSILPLMDDFERALSHMGDGSECTAIKEGIDLIYGKFVEFLKQNGIKEIESLNCPFNVDLHDAVAKVKVEEEDKKGRIIDVIQKGYYLQDKILRHSKVVVGE
ncbi:MAG: nucleotide exchange factor GrpE [Bacteroidota bacterium]